jgi:hypothetical protein
MATVSGPYGLQPANKLGGAPFAGSTRMYSIASAYAVTIQTGDPVIFVTTGATRGTIARFNATTTATTATASGTFLGVFMGVMFTDATLGPTFRQNWVASTVATDALAYVLDDPDALFQVQADGVLAQTTLGTNAGLIQTVAGSATLNKISGVALQASSIATTTTLPLRIVDFVRGPTSAIGDTFTDVLVRFNNHFHRQTTGVAAT